MRKGMTIGQGKGYRNYRPMLGHDKRVHTQSGHGMKQPQRMPYMSINPAMAKYSNAKLQEGMVKEHIEHPKFTFEQARQIAKDHLTENPRAYGKCNQYVVYTKKGTKGHIYAESLKSAKALATKHGLKTTSVFKGGKCGGKFVVTSKNALTFKDKNGVLITVDSPKDFEEWENDEQVKYLKKIAQKNDATFVSDNIKASLRGGKMSKKDYEAFAKIMGSSKSREEMEGRLESYMAEDNPRFDSGRFKNKKSEWEQKGGKRIRKGKTFFQGDKIKQGNWSDKRWKRARTKDNKQIGKEYESWEKSKSQRWK